MKRVSLLLLLLFGLTGCNSLLFQVEVDSLSTYVPKVKNTYILLPGNKDVQSSDLQYQEFAKYFKKVLGEQGFQEVQYLDDADLAIFLSYGISGPQEKQYSYSMPVWGQTGYSSSSTYGHVDSCGNYSGTTYYNPTYGVTGYQQRYGSYTDYTGYMFITAYDSQEYLKSKKEIKVWEATATSTGGFNDLRRIFPYMLAATRDYLCKSTNNKITVIYKENDPAVLAVQGQLDESTKKK